MGLIHKTKFVPFIDISTTSTPTWRQIKKSNTYSLTFNPQTKTFDFISSENPEEEIDSYQPALSQSLTMFDDEPDFKTIFDMAFHLPIGGEAHRNVLLAFYASKYTTPGENPVTYYKAWLVDSVVKLGTLDSVNQSIDFDLALNNHDTGAVTVAAGVPTWVAGTWDGEIFTPAANAASTPASGGSTPASGDSTPASGENTGDNSGDDTGDGNNG